MQTLGIAIVTAGSLAVVALVIWQIWDGLRLKRQVDADYRQLREIEKSRERSVLASLKSTH